MTWIDYNQIQDDLVSLISAANLGFHAVQKEADERDYNMANFPLADVRLTDQDSDLRAGSDYYVTLIFDIQVTVHDLSSFSEAATLRNTLLRSLIDTIRNNVRFSSSIESTIIGPASFETAKDERTGAFMSAATVQVQTKSFVDK